MKKLFMILILIISFIFITGCKSEEVIKIYDDVDIIDKVEKEETEEVEEDDFEILEYSYFSKPDISLFVTKSNVGSEYADYYLHFVASREGQDVWEYKSSPYFIGMYESNYYVYDAINAEKIYIFETECITALDLSTGKVLWQNKDSIVKDITNGVVISDTLYIKNEWDKTIYSINKNTGKQQKAITIPSRDENEFFRIIGAYNNSIIVQSNADDGGYYLLNPRNNSFTKMNLYLND